MTHDRPSVVTVAILQIVRQALLARLHRDDIPAIGLARSEIETLLRDEFFDVARQAVNDIPHDD